MGTYSSVNDHRSMVFDDTRNNIYTRALENIITPETVVLDLGSGLGIHGLVAAKFGAKKVYMIDPSPVLRVTEKIAIANGLSDRIECIQKPVEQVELPEKVDVIVSVFTGNFLLTEDLLPLLFQARDRFLSGDGALLPDRARMEVTAVSVPEYYEKHISCWGNPSQDIDYGLVRNYAVNNLYYSSPDSLSAEILSKPVNLVELDFMTETDASCRSTVQVEIDTDGLCHGWLGWFQARLGENWLSTSPFTDKTHWNHAFMPLGTPLRVKKGDMLEFELHRPELGEWTWKTGAGGHTQRHSTFLSAPLLPAQLLKQTKGYQAKLSRQGEVVRNILNSFDGSTTNEAIIDKISKMNPDLFHIPQNAESLIRKLIDKYGE